MNTLNERVHNPICANWFPIIHEEKTNYKTDIEKQKWK